MRTRRSSSPFTNRILIGAVTVLVLMVAVFLAYNANSGLPFVPTYDINVEVPDAAGLIPSNSVLVGGTRVGYIGSVTAAKLRNGRPIAILHLKLNKSVEPLPADSTDLVRPVSPLGLKYLQITIGHSHQTLSPGATIALAKTHLPVEIDDFFNMFDAKTRHASQIDLNNFGDGFAGRGSDLNRALSQIKPLVDTALPVMRNLLNPQTHWAQLFPSLEQAAHEVLGVAHQQADLFSRIGQTFTPLSQDTPELQAAITGGPPSLQTATQQLPAEAQFTDDTADLFHRFQPAFAELSAASVQLAPAEADGIRALPSAPLLNDRLTSTLEAIQRLAYNPSTLPGLALLTETAQLLEPTVAYIEPAQTACNYVALAFRNLEVSLSESDQVGTMLRVLGMAAPQLPNSESGPSSAPANGPPSSAFKHQSLGQQSLVDDSFPALGPVPVHVRAGTAGRVRGRERALSERPPGDRRCTGVAVSHRANEASQGRAAMRWAERGISPIRASVIGILLLAVATYFIFTKQLPFTHHFTIKAVVNNSNLLSPGSPVRIGGDQVGEVEGTGRYRNTSLAVVTMQIDDRSQAIHSDATIAIRPRLFLEGNFYVQLSPGTPNAPPIADGGTIPVGHTSDPVQIDELLDALPGQVRTELRSALQGFGRSLDASPSLAEDARLDPAVRGLTGGQAINKTFDTSVASLRDSAMVSEALTGAGGDQLARVVSGFARASAGLAHADGQLGEFISEFDRTLQATAAQQQALRATVSELGPTAQNANTAFAALDRAFPATERFSDAFASGLPQLPATITSAYPWLAQASPLFSDRELGGLLGDLQPASSDLAELTHDQLKFMPAIDEFDRCMIDVFIPTGNLVVNDGSLSAGVANYKEFWYAMAGQSGASQGADGNGPYLRVNAGGGPYSVETGQTNYYGNNDTGFAQMAAPPLRTRPAFPNSVPPLQRSVPCWTQPVPDVNGPASTGPADGSRPNAARPPLPNDPARSGS